MKFFHLIPEHTNINFISKFKIFGFSSILILGVVIAGIWTKGFNFGIDFTGGTVVHAKFSQGKPDSEVRALVTELGFPDASVVALGQGNQEYLITTRSLGATHQVTESIEKRLVAKLGSQITVLRADSVGPKVGAELKLAALKSLFYSVILITIYIWLRFDVRFAPGATVAMLHDIVVAGGFYVFSGNEFTITAIAALLTIAGYSVNDTIVIYDRVRELLKHGGDARPLSQVINEAINLTLSRTILTSGVTFLSIIPIAIFCSGEIASFSYAMLVGIFVGTYSTIYVAAPFTIYVERFLDKRKGLSTSRVGSRA